MLIRQSRGYTENHIAFASETEVHRVRFLIPLAKLRWREENTRERERDGKWAGYSVLFHSTAGYQNDSMISLLVFIERRLKIYWQIAKYQNLSEIGYPSCEALPDND